MAVLLVGVCIAPSNSISSANNNKLSDATTVIVLGIILLIAHSCSVKDNVVDSVKVINAVVVEEILHSAWPLCMLTQLLMRK